VSDDSAFAPALDLAARIRAGEMSSVELTELYLERIERLDPELNSYVTVDAEGALASARAPADGPFSGVPIPIKDLTATAGLRDENRVVGVRGQLGQPRASLLGSHRVAELVRKRGQSVAVPRVGGPDEDASRMRAWLTSRALSIAGGTTEIQLNLISRRWLGLPVS